MPDRRTGRALGWGVALAVVAGSALPARADRAWFQGIGVLAGGVPPRTITQAMSADGSVVVGQAYSSRGGEMFRWTRAGGMVGLGGLGPLPYQATAFGISGDGSTVVGDSFFAPSSETSVRWTAAYGLQALPGMRARAASFDGSVIVGDTGEAAYRFTALTGAVSLGTLFGGTGYYSSAMGVSSDGLTIVGSSQSPVAAPNLQQAFRWTPASLMVGLGFLPGGSAPQSHAHAVSADGLVVVGDSTSAGGTQAFRWTQQGGMQGLGFLPGFAVTQADAVSADGSVVVGNASGPGDTAFIWTATAGIRDLRSVLSNEHGLSLTGWTLYIANGISADGSTIVGYGLDPCGADNMGWIAHLGTSPPCRADFNGDGTVTVSDIFAFLGAWFSSDHRADFDSANCVTVADIFAFLSAWFAGCP